MAASAVWLALGATATAAETPAHVHSNPEPGDNVRVYAYVEAPVLLVALDGAAPWRQGGQSVAFFQAAPGAHSVTASLESGEQVKADITLSPDNLIESKGRRWWCLMAGRRHGQLAVFLATPEQCKKIADVGPD
jgi:hypothetical protein